jgi:hypothetical protein
MTLNLMIINRSGVWQSADLRVCDPLSRRVVDDYSPKQVALRCTDGAALLTYAGVGWVARVNIADWIRQILRGESRTVDESLLYLRDRASRDLGPKVRGKFPHVFTVGAFVNGRPWVAQIRNFQSYGSRALGEFYTIVQRVTEDGMFFVVGTGPVSAADRGTLARASKITPREPKHFRNLLAAINKRAAAMRNDGWAVSPHCVSAYLPPQGEPLEVEFHGTRRAPTLLTVPSLLLGIDLTEMTRWLAAKSIAADSNLEQAAREAVVARNPLRCRK